LPSFSTSSCLDIPIRNPESFFVALDEEQPINRIENNTM